MPGPLPVSPETAMKLSKHLGVPLEHLMHMPRHILLQKLAEMASREQTDPHAGNEDAGRRTNATADSHADDKTADSRKPAADPANASSEERGAE